MEVIEIDNSLNVMANKSFVVTMIESNPYVMLRQEVIMMNLIFSFQRQRLLFLEIFRYIIILILAKTVNWKRQV